MLKVEVNIDEQVIHRHRQLLHSRLYTQIRQVANTPNVEDIGLSLPNAGENRVLGPDHNIAIVSREANAISPRDLLFAATKNNNLNNPSMKISHKTMLLRIVVNGSAYHYTILLIIIL